MPCVLLRSHTASPLLHVWVLLHELPNAYGFPCKHLGTCHACTYHQIVTVVAKMEVARVLG